MGYKLLLACGILICLYVITVQGKTESQRFNERGTRRNVGFRRKLPAPTPGQRTGGKAPASNSGERRQKAEAARAARQAQSSASARGALATQAGSRSGPPLLQLSAGSAGQRAASHGFGGSNNVVIAGGKTYVLINGRVWINGYRYVVCGNYLMPEDFYICCQNEPLFQTPDDPIACCGPTYYFTNTEICCDGWFHDKYELDGTERICCGIDYYFPDTEICCGGQYQDALFYGCCGETLYFKPLYCCTAGGIQPIISGLCAGNLCGGSPLQPSQTCCDDVIHTTISQYSCCGKRYIPPDFICCGGLPFHSYFYRCCQNNRYFYQEEVCCFNGVIAPIGTFCSAGGGGNGYNTGK